MTTKSTELMIRLPDGTADAVLYAGDESVARRGVILIPDVGGPRAAVEEVALAIAKEGYVVLVPNPFFRTSRPPVFPFPRIPGDARTRIRMSELLGPLTPEAMDADLGCYIDFMRSYPGISAEGLGIVGFCVGGLMAFRAAAVRPEDILVAASFHGGGLVRRDDPTSPHLNLPKIRATLYFAHAVEDSSMTAEAIRELDEALTQWGRQYESEVYDGARHGWTLRDNPTYNQSQAERAIAKLRDLLAKHLC